MAFELLPGLMFAFMGVALAMAALWYLAVRYQQAGIADFGWACAIGVITFVAGAAPDLEARGRGVAVLAVIWALRLAIHLFRDRIWRKPEDRRYQRLRASWGAAANRNFFFYFQIQGILSLVFAVPILIAVHNPSPLRPWIDGAGLFVWLAAIVGEWLADAQLLRFRADPESRGKTCRRGLWRYSRHPNYFFEWLHWWSYVLWGWGSPWFLLTLVAPALILFFLCKLTGIPATEAQALESRGDDYREYQRTTSPFIPWFPKE